jgi:hypothetical protein
MRSQKNYTMDAVPEQIAFNPEILEDELGNKVSVLNPFIRFSANCVDLHVVEGIADLSSSELSAYIKQLEQLLAESLHNNSQAIFKKDFPLEKFTNSLQSVAQEDSGRVHISLSPEDVCFISPCGVQFKVKQDEEYSGNGKVVLQLVSVTFIQNTFHANFVLLSFFESEEQQEVAAEEEPEPEPEVPEEEPQVENENFF